MNNQAEKFYNNLNQFLKSKINFPNYYFDLTPDQKDFINSFFVASEHSKNEELRKQFTYINDHVEYFLTSLDKVDEILNPLE